MARRICTTGLYSSDYEQSMATGQLWVGLAPTNEDNPLHADKGVFKTGLFEVPIDTANNRGGLFKFGHVYPARITEVKLKIPAGTTSWSLYIDRFNGSIHEMMSGTSVGDITMTKEIDELQTLKVGDDVRLVSTGVPIGPSKCLISTQYMENK